ncbi:mediator of RNA polymerase II transcription subunit 6-like isoform X2 [Amphiura filiformis]
MSWHDSAGIPHLNQHNVMEYFAERSNPFYDRTCNNEMVKMQRLDPEQMKSMTGLEYRLLHVQEPILYVVRKLHRHSPTQETPIADYYIIAGVVYQAPDLCSVLNARMLTAVHNIQSAFDESISYSRYHPSKGYWWEFKDKDQEKTDKKAGKKEKKEPSSIFQRQRVDVLLGELARKFPPKVMQPKPGEKPVPVESVDGASTNGTMLGGSSNGTMVGGPSNGTMPGGGATVKEEKDVKEEGQSQGNSGAIFSSAYANSMKPPMAKKRKVMK